MHRNTAGMKESTAQIRVWLRQKLAERGHGAKGKLAQFMNVSPSAISRMISTRPGTEDRTIEATELLAMERFFGERMPIAPWDAREVSQATSDEPVIVSRRAQVYGEVAAGIWQEEEIWDEQKYDSVPIVPGKYERLEQRAFFVRGPSMDQRRIYDGDFVITVKYFEVRDAAVDGDLVVVSRCKGGLCERTVKEVATFLDRIELWPRSSDSRYQTPIVIMKNSDPLDDVTVEITDLVIGAYRPMA